MSTRAFRFSLFILVAAFALLLVGRNHIRAHWWGMRLASTSDLAMQGYYLACLAGVGDAAHGPALSLARNERADVRLLSIYALQQLPENLSVPEIARLLADSDLTVREAAATALVFTESEPATRALIQSSASTNADEAATAVSALARIDSTDARTAIARAMRSHGSPVVRAQAVEAAMDSLLHPMPTPPTLQPNRTGDPVNALIDALQDHAPFDGMLAMERQLRAAAAFVDSHTATRPAPGPEPTGRTVGGFAAACISDLMGEVVIGPTTVIPTLRKKLEIGLTLGLADRQKELLIPLPDQTGNRVMQSGH